MVAEKYFNFGFSIIKTFENVNMATRIQQSSDKKTE